MTAITRDRRPSLDVQAVNSLDPDSLSKISDEEFKALVEADLLRKASRSGVTLKSALVRALRSPENVERWYAALLRTAKSVENQLAARRSDYESRRAQMRSELLRLEHKLHLGEEVSDRDTGRVMSTIEVQDAITSLKMRLENLRADHAKGRAGSIRFKTGVDDHIIEARFLCDQVRHARFDSLVARERNRYAERARTLEEAIAQHRAQVAAEGDEPDDIDERLWGVIGVTAA